MKKPKFNFRTHVWPKYVISAGVLAAATAITFGSLYGCSKNSDEKQGKSHPGSEKDFRNFFVDVDKAESRFVSNDKSREIAKFDFKNNQVINKDGSTVAVDKFLDDYYKEHKALPFLNIKYGSFNFYNEYIEAVSPLEFQRFSNWFMTNVSWGPEIITLKSFSIVKGVEMHGNNITLGSHSTKNKELTTIKFYPDAFFGTLPIYSELRGSGNAQDSLVYKVNSKLLTSTELKEFLANISSYNAVANYSAKTISTYGFRNILDYRSLINQKVWTISGEWKNKIKKQAFNNVELSRLEWNDSHLTLIYGKDEATARANLQAALEKYKGSDEFNVLSDIVKTTPLVQKTIVDVRKILNPLLSENETKDSHLNITFNDGTNMDIFNSFENITYKDKDKFVKNPNVVNISKGFNDSIERVSLLKDEFVESIRKVTGKNNISEKDVDTYINAINESGVLAQEIQVMKKQLEKLIELLSLQEEFKKEVDKYETKVNEQKAKLVTDKAKLDEATAKFTAKQQEVKQLEEQEKSNPNDQTIKTKLAKAKQELDDLEVDKKRAERDHKRISAALKVNEDNLTKAKAKVWDDDTKVKKASEIEKLEKEIAEKEQQWNEILTKHSKLENGLSQNVLKTLRDIIHLYKLFSEEKDIQTHKKLEKNIDDLEPQINKSIYVYKNELATSFDLIRFNYSEKLKEITTPFFENKPYKKTTFTPFIYYTTDIAYLPNQLIALDSLLDISRSAQLNWRNFYNLDGFIRSTTVDEVKNDGFYVYTKKIKSLEDDFNAKNSNLKVEYDKTVNELNKQIDEKRQFDKVINDYHDIVSGKENEDSIKNLLKGFTDINTHLPEGYKLLGNHGSNPFTSGEFIDAITSKHKSLDGKHLVEYINLVLNGLPNAQGEHQKEGFIKYYQRIESKITTGSNEADKLYKEMKELVVKRFEILDKLKIQKSDLAPLQAEFIIVANKYDELKVKWVKEYDKDTNKTWYIDPNQIILLYRFKKNLEFAKAQAEKQATLLEEYKKNRHKSYMVEREIEFLKFKIHYFTQVANFDNAEVIEQYKKIVAEYETNKKDKMPQQLQKVVEAEVELSDLHGQWYLAILKENGSYEQINAFYDHVYKNAKYYKDAEMKQLSDWAEILNDFKKKYENTKKLAEETKTKYETAENEIIPLITEYNAAFEAEMTYNSGGASGSGIQVTKKAKERLKDIYEEKVKFLELVSKSAKETIEKHNKTLEELNKTTQNLKEEYEKTTTTNERKVEIHVLISRLTQSADGLRNTIRHLIQLQLEFESLVARHNEITKGIKSNTHSYRDVFDFDDAFLKRLQSVEKDNVYKLDNTTRRYLIQFKSIWRSYVSEFNLEFEQQLSITKKGEKLTDLRAQIAKDKALYAKLNAEYKNEESLYNILQNIQTSPHKEAIEKIQKLLDAKNSKFAELSSSNLYFEKLMPPYTLINKVDKTQNENIGNLIIELEEKVKSSYFNDELIKKLNKAKNDIEDNNSELNKAKEKSKQALVSSGLQSELDALNSAKAEYLKVVDKFSQTYINRIYAKGVMSYISAERATNVVSEYEELVAKITSLADTKDGVTFIINNIEGIENQLALDQDKTLIEAVEQIRKIEKMTTDLVEKAKNILDHQDVKPYLDMIENMFSEFVSKARSLFSSNYINDPIISKLLEEVNAKKLEAIKNQFSATGKDESLEKYKQMISEGFKKTIDALLYTKENEQSLAALRTYFSAILTNSEFKNNKGLEWAKIAFMKLVNIEQARAQSQDLTKIQAELSETNTKVTTVENEIKALDQTIKTYTDQIATASSREEKIKISQELKPYLAQRDDKHKELASLKLAVKYLTSRSESTLAEKLNKAKVAFGINEVNITKELLFDISSASGAVAQRLQDVFNQNIKKYIKQIEKVDSILKPAKDYLVSFNDKYLKLLNPSIDTYSKASEHKTNALKDSISKLIDARIREIQLEGREKELYANNSDELVNADDLVVAKSKSELLDILASKKLIEADKIKEANKDIYYVKLSNVEKDKSKLVVTLRNIAKNPDLAYSKIYTEKYIKFNLDASVEDQRLKVVNAIFNISNFKKQITPTLIREEGNIRDRFGKSVKGYSVFVDAYEDMTSTLLREVPYAGEWLEGEHLVSKINEDGVMEFSVQNGKYLGFTKDTRVGLWAILKMSDPNFKGISTDFLKFVGAHEYGHHITLNGAHDLGNKGEKPIYVSALTPGATPRIDNYYSKDALNLYLKARTHLQLNTTRLLKGNNVVIDYGEYITFGIPKIEIDKDGKKVLKYENEKEEDIWGTKLSQDDVIATLKNNKRRFLQNFQGLMEATKARRDANGLSDPNDQKLLTVFNLWLMNSLDHHSGTINPSLTGGTAKYMVWDSTKKRYVFKPGSLEILKGILKDGKGNKVEFEEVNGELIPKVVEGEKDANGNYIKINKVLMFNADGTPVINVPLNLDFNDKTSPYYDANALKYVNSKIKSIIETVKSLIVEKFSIRGWDNLDTDLSLEPKVIISNSYLNTLFGRGDFWIDKVNDLVYKAFVTNRDHENGGLKDANAPLPYYDEKGNLKVAPGVRLPQSSMYVNIKKYASVIGQQENLTSLMFAMNTAGNSFNNLVNSGEGYILHVDKDHQYLPNIKLANAFQNIFFYDQVKHLEEFLQLKKMLKWYSQYTSDFIGNDVNKHLWFAIDDSNSPLQILPNGKRNPNVKLMKINGRVVEKHPNLSLYNSFYSEENSQKSFGDQVEFKDYKKFLEFVSVDLKKAKLDKNTKTVNWDVNYVKGKVDFAKFITGLNDAIAKDKLLEQKDKDFYQKLVDNNNEQEIANEIMFRFSNSNLAMLMSNITIDDVKKNPEYGWVFDQAHGYGDLRSATLNTINPEAKKLEISLTEYIKAYEDKANEWNAQLNQFNLFDALIFDGKTSTYTSQTVGKMLENDNLVYSILITLGKGMIKKIKPSQDVLDYYGSKTERKFNEFFTDYTYNFAEVINRDNLQITYSPATSNFGNMPSYLSGLSEANTGLEYVVDGASTSKWLELLIKFRGNENSAGIRDTLIDYESLLNDEEKRRARILNTRHIERFFANSDNIIYGQNYSSNYFGKFQTINNGWFKDRWYREFLDFKLYDDEGKDIVDDTIRINDLEGKRVKTRARAYWQYYIQSQGVGRRNISGIWRDSDKDAVAMFGYLSSAVADKANYLAFKNVRTGQVKTLRITKQNASNMFYYKEQQINNEERHQNGEKVRHYLSDEPYNFSDKNGHQKGTGFVAWVSDYGIMSRYRNRLLDTNEEYYVYFASDVYGSKALEADLGKWESIAENGKTFSQAPISIYKDADGNFRLRVQDQFNGVI